MPFYRFHLNTTLPEVTAFGRVQELTGPYGPFRAGPPFLGTVQPSSFQMRRDIRYRNSFLPLLSGKVTPTPRGSRIDVTMSLHPFAVIFMIIWFSVLGYVIVQLWVHRKEAAPFALLAPATMLLFGVTLMVGCFVPEAIKAKRLLESAFDKWRI